MTDPTIVPPMQGVWVAFYSDRSGVSVWPTELEALREGVARSMQVEFRHWGVDLFTAEKP